MDGVVAIRADFAERMLAKRARCNIPTGDEFLLTNNSGTNWTRRRAGEILRLESRILYYIL